MIITICILILVYSLTGKPVDKLLGRVRNINWKRYSDGFMASIRKYGIKAGRVAARPALQFYYVLKEGDVSTLDRALLIGAIAYIIIPVDLLPRAVFRWIGTLDDLGAAIFVYNKVKDKYTPSMEAHVQSTLDDWFGPEEAVVVK